MFNIFNKNAYMPIVCFFVAWMLIFIFWLIGLGGEFIQRVGRSGPIDWSRKKNTWKLWINQVDQFENEKKGFGEKKRHTNKKRKEKRLFVGNKNLISLYHYVCQWIIILFRVRLMNFNLNCTIADPKLESRRTFASFTCMFRMCEPCWAQSTEDSEPKKHAYAYSP